MKQFSFVVLTYNHQNYIISHLESIKYQILTYGAGIDFELIIADDFSQDQTLSLAKFWLGKNVGLFKHFTISNQLENNGTCKNLIVALNNLKTSQCKITAGDDIYSYENLIEEFIKIPDFHVIQGLPLYLIDNEIKKTRFMLFNIIGTNEIYKKRNHIHMLQGINFFHAPSIVYNMNYLHQEVRNFLLDFLVTEDYPLLSKIFESNSLVKFEQINKIFIYYRRTSGSTYLIKHNEFVKDKNKIFNYLLNKEKNTFYRVILRNRIYVFNKKAKFQKRICNIGLYVYLFKVIVYLKKILKIYLNLNVNIQKHQTHYNYISLMAQKIHDEYFCQK